MWKYILSYNGVFLEDSADNNGCIFETEEEAIEEAKIAMDEYMDYWDIEGNEYDSGLFDYEIDEVLI